MGVRTRVVKSLSEAWLEIARIGCGEAWCTRIPGRLPCSACPTLAAQDADFDRPRPADRRPDRVRAVVRDDLGLPVPPALLRAAWMDARHPRRVRKSPPKGVPVPHSGRRRGGRCFRHPGCLPQRRAADALRADIRAGEDSFELLLGLVRPEGEHRPPTSYDDLVVACLRDRSWKIHRRTQWRG